MARIPAIFSEFSAEYKTWTEVDLALSYQAEFRLIAEIPAENPGKNRRNSDHSSGIPAISMVRSGTIVSNI
jgi:hypothetical protein